MNRHLLLFLLLFPILLSAQTAETQIPAEPDIVVGNGVDYKILKYLQDHRTPAGNRVWLTVSNSVILAPAPAVGFAVGAVCTDEQSVRRSRFVDAGELMLSELFNISLTMGTKAVVRRPRPWVAYEGDLMCLQTVRSASFPSGHTSVAFAAATSLSLISPRWYVVVPAYLWAGAVGFSRMYVGAHFPSDVFAGALVGTGSALLMHLIRQRIWDASDAAATPSKSFIIPITISF